MYLGLTPFAMTAEGRTATTQGKRNIEGRAAVRRRSLASGSSLAARPRKRLPLKLLVPRDSSSNLRQVPECSEGACTSDGGHRS